MASFHKKQSVPSMTAAISALSLVEKDLRNKSVLSGDTARNVMSFESDSEADTMAVLGDNLSSTHKSIEESLRDSDAFMEVIQSRTKNLSADEAAAAEARAIDAAAMSFMTSVDARSYLTSQNGEVSNGHDFVVGSIKKSAVSMEAFADASFDDFASQTAMINALNAISRDQGIELFFPSYVLEPSKQGVMVELNNEYIYDRTERTDGKFADNFTKTPLYKSITDSSILENNKTEIIPNGAASETLNQESLVPVASWANVNREVDGVIIETRPLASGVEIKDLLQLGRRPTVNGVLDETDILEEAIELTGAGVALAYDNGSTTETFRSLLAVSQCTFTESVTRQQSAEVVLNRELKLTVSSKTKAWATNATAEASLGLAAAFGLASDKEVIISFSTRVTGNFNHETANGSVSFSKPVITSIIADGVPQDLKTGVAKDFVDNLTFTVPGYSIRAFSSLANSRILGRMVDTDNKTRYLFPLVVRSPYSSRSPSNGREGGGANLQSLAKVNRQASQSQAIRTLLAFESQADDINAMTLETAATTYPAAKLGVKPMVVTRNHDLKTELTVEYSAGNFDDLRSFVINAITSIVDKLVLESGYLAALEQYEGADRDFDIIAMTDWRLAGLIMRSGDPRPLGHGRNLKIGTTHEVTMRDKIYISVRRNRALEESDVLSLGTHPTKTALVYENGSHTHKGAVTKLIQTQAIDLTAIMCPLLGVLTLQNVDGFYEKQQ